MACVNKIQVLTFGWHLEQASKVATTTSMRFVRNWVEISPCLSQVSTLLVDAILRPLSLIKARNLHGLLGYLILRQRKLSFTLLHIPMNLLTHPNTLLSWRDLL